MKKVDSRVIRRKKEDSQGEETFFATTYKGVEKVLAKELSSLGVSSIKNSTRGISFKGSIKTMYKVNLWSRTANRILWQIGSFPSADKDQLYQGVRSFDWSEHMDEETTFMVDSVGTNEKLIHTQYISLVIKDAIVDWWRDKKGKRPSVDLRSPKLRINARINGLECTLNWDTSGARLHKRGYRGELGEAPLKENLAAAILLMSNYNGKQELLDPMCGSGTFLIEAALIAKNKAPGLLGRKFAFCNHPTFRADIWRNLVDEANASIDDISGVPIIGYDRSEDAVRSACAAAIGSGMDDIIRIRKQNLGNLEHQNNKCIVINPPYGERLGELNKLVDLYMTIGKTFRHKCHNSLAHVITNSKFLSSKIGIKPNKQDVVWNGPLECRLLHYKC